MILVCLVLHATVAATTAAHQDPVPGGGSASPTQSAPTKATEWVTPAVRAPRVSFHTFESACAKATVSYHLYTPAAHDRDPDARFPVVYWLHGSGGGAAGIAPLARLVDEAIESRSTPPCFVVFVNGLPQGMYVDWKDGSTPIESMIVKDLVPHIDATCRTIPTREGRLLDGFSMGGYGAARLGFAHPELFRAVSMLGAGPLDPDFERTPRANPRARDGLLERVYGDRATFREVSPWVLAERNADRLKQDTMLRIAVGDRDETFAMNKEFHEHLAKLGIHGIGISIGAGRLSVEYPTRSPPARAPSDGHWRARGLVRAPRGPWERRAPRGERCRRGPIRRAGGTAAHAEGPRVAAGRRGRAQGTVGASADGRGARDAPRLAGARVDGGLLAPAWVACAAREARVRRCARIWSITDAWVMNATMRMAPWQVGHASESTSNICCSRVAHRRLASVGASLSAGAIAGGVSAGAGSVDLFQRS
jgi:enterochelin esterase-like enzyme